MLIESRERARRNPSRYPCQKNQRPCVKRRAPRLINRSRTTGKDNGIAPRRRNHLRYQEGTHKVGLWRRLCMLLGRR